MSYCSSCGINLRTTAIRPPSTIPLENKNPGLAALLALLPGLIGLMGIGHIYVGRIRRGVLLLIGGPFLVITGVGFLLFSVFGFITPLIGLVGFVLLLGAIVLWFWQVFNAYSLAKKFNALVRETGKPPW